MPDTQQVMDAFYSKVQELGKSGAIFMAVCRGKVWFIYVSLYGMDKMGVHE